MNRTVVDRREQSATEERALGANRWLVAPGVWRLKDIFVNVFLIQNREGTEWVLVDTGLKTTGAKLKTLVGELFGKSSVPKAIIMTHGHFDHRGSLMELASAWGVPVYCHHQEKPYLTGASSYPPPDPSVGGGAMALLSFAYPKGPIHAEAHLRELPEDGTIAELPEWKWIHTPGHTPGHCVLYVPLARLCFCGDVIFAGSVGRTDLPGASWEQLEQSIRTQIFTLPDDTRLLSGHGPETTVGEEKISNPFVGRL